MDGFELIGFGVRQKALAGAGLADSRDAMAMSLNPAGIAGLGRGFQIGLAAMLPERGYRTQGFPVVLAPGDVRSGRGVFPMGNIAYVAPIDAESSWGVTSYSHGGINTAYSAEGSRPLLGPSLGGPFGGGFAGMDYQRQFISLAYARKFGPLSIGVAPTIALQFFNVQGLGRLAPLSQNPQAFTNKGDNWSFGGGVRVGLQYEVTPALRIAVAGSTPMFMTALGSYAGLIAGQGALDVPGHVSAGFAYDVTPDLTAMADWKRIFYGQEPALANSSFPIMPGGPGSTNGPGFGARDIDAQAVGLEWRATPALTLRIGYRHNSLPFGGRDVTLNVLAPGLTEHHASGGFNFKLTKNSSIDFSFIHGFRNSISGYETVPFTLIGGVPVLPQVNYGARISPWLEVSEVSLGYNYAFDADDSALLPARF
jgi:long-chain fatty acid transport protein